ncbi:unannotated protein [freshwater metagenome]|uniref:anthranilate phosphoribosyltransferase n=1 Tax=freshwater metagenome TaxID=449393 RepID=A0A6J7IIK8_9ZZZZ|nr:anthranilate phosphoribosyltransferase [Actinomycetota bacterium]
MSHDLLTTAIDDLASRRDIGRERSTAVLGEILDGRASDAQIAAFLIALRTKGETEDELTGLAEALRGQATQVHPLHEDLLDTAGTGGGRRTFNVSTTAALIAAGAGCVVAKHGNRSATGLSGSADVLEALGARLDLGPEAEARAIDETGFGFMFAPAHHAAMRHVVPVRKALAVRTVFNLLGPLTNPAGARRQLVGISDPGALDIVAGALQRLGVERALVVSGDDGLDELSISSPTHVVEVNQDSIRRYVVEPAQVGVRPAGQHETDGGDPARNAEITRSVLAGEPGPALELSVLNAGAAIYAAARADDIASGVELARAAIESGAAQRTLDAYVALSRELAA